MKLEVAAVLLLAGCSVDRRSTGLACTPQAQCDNGRVCDQGYCVVGGGSPHDAGVVGPTIDAPSCPSQCTMCELGNMTCEIEGTGGADIACPPGWSCTIDCIGGNGCGKITCDQAVSCTVSCIGGGACGDVTCGPGRCQVGCTGGGACGAIDCRASCRCDVACPTGDCGQTMCPKRANGDFCTMDGTDGKPCMSSVSGQCRSC